MAYNRCYSGAPWCPYTGAEGAKAVSIVKKYQEDIRRHIDRIAANEKNVSSTLTGKEIKDFLYAEIFEHKILSIENAAEIHDIFKTFEGGYYGDIAHVSLRMRILEEQSEFARCKGKNCPKAQLVKTDDSRIASGERLSSKKYLFCGGTWLPDQNKEYY